MIFTSYAFGLQELFAEQETDYSQHINNITMTNFTDSMRTGLPRKKPFWKRKQSTK